MTTHFNSLNDAASFLIPYMRNHDHFQELTLEDRVMDGEVYAIEATLDDPEDPENFYFHDEEVREAMEWMADATPAERLALYKEYGRECDQEDLNAIDLAA